MSWRNYQDPDYKNWRNAVYKRDRFTCQWPGCFWKRKRIQAHHIRKWAIFPSLRYALENGITLCSGHHKMIEKNEDAYVVFFMQILLDKRKK